MTATRKQRYDIALNSQGFILATDPKHPAIKATQDAVYTQRYAQGDRDYNDFEKWWYLIQTDWSGGFKDSVSWLDDAKFYYSTNVEMLTEGGAVKLASGIVLDHTFADDIIVMSYETPVATSFPYLGTDQIFSTKPAIFYLTGGVWTNISSGWMPTTASLVSEIIGHKQKIFFSTIGAGPTYVVGKCDFDGTNNVDYSGAIGTACDGITLANGYCMAEDGNTLWAGVAGTVAQNYITKSVDAGANWTKVLSSGYEKVLCILPIGTSIYYLTVVGNTLRFKVYDGSTTTTIFTFPAIILVLGNAGSTGTASRRALVLFNNKIVISKRNEIWEYDITTGEMTRTWSRDSNKETISSTLAVGETINQNINGLQTGAILHTNQLYWTNLILDNQGHFYNGKREITDADILYGLKPVMSNGLLVYWVDNNDFTKLYVDSGYKGTADKNYFVFNQFDKISGIDKLAYSATVLFSKFASGQKITVEYTTDELSSSVTWTVLGSASYAVDGANVTSKKFYFGDAVTFKKIWIRIKLEGDATTTPTYKDFIMEYLPLPDYKLNWQFTVKCIDEILRKDQSNEVKNGVWLRNFLRDSWVTKSILTYEDFDAAAEERVSGSLTISATTITVKGTTDNFPERGRVLIGSEEIQYNGRNKTQLLNCTRAARGTVASAHSDSDAVSLAYRVLIRNYSEQLVLANDPNKPEYRVTLDLAEV